MGGALAADLAEVDGRLRDRWSALAEARLLITGGTGFYGCWLLETLLHAADARGLSPRIDVLTRDPAGFAARTPHLAGHRLVSCLRGDVCGLVAGEACYTHVIHAATEASAALNEDAPLAMYDTIVAGTRAVLEVARTSGARVLLASSGAIYGPQPAELANVPEEHPGGPDPFQAGAAYAEGKRAAETLGAIYGARHGLEVVVARGFAFVGPYLPLDRHFAIGNFIGDALAGRPVRVNGDGTPYRSYMYAGDLAAWLWTLLLDGRPGRAYNVGAEQAVTIGEAAALVARIAGVPVEIARRPSPGLAASRYVPSTRRAAEELGLVATVELEEAIRRTLAWHQARGAAARA